MAVGPVAAFSAPRLPAAAMSVVASEQPVLHLAARKGTRNFQPDGAGTPPPSTAGQPDVAASADSTALEQCMATWDSGTHITKSRWREICQRQINERGQTEAGSGQ